MTQGIILPSFYLGPIAAFSAINAIGNVPIYLEQYEHFPKQTYRNRASIYSPNGKLDLIVPVVKGSKVHTKMKDVRIAYEYDWQRLHWMSLQTCYRRSAYFEYYEDEFAPFYEERHDYLFDLNEALLELIMRCVKLNREIRKTSTYESSYPDCLDLRESIHPKKEAPGFAAKPYFQVFEPKHGFLPNLSIVDLLFNQGPNSRQYL
ncbi:WbqC family protein [Olivibacter sitiensis]|uniref:WbqC family protein n=1 Tax=Olivibacter sitiensis TaxID=376470 RepID=UPI00041D228D|nr:WbqC family protein [Olivibacter sitiensis]